MKKFLALWSLMTLGFVTADVSHLGLTYLPPMTMMSNNEFRMHQGNGQNGLPQQMTTTTIEKQYLHELPEQIEYDNQLAPEYGGHMPMSMPMMNNMMTTMMMKTNMGIPNDISEMMPTPAEFMQPPPMEKPVIPLYNAPKMLYMAPYMNLAPTRQQHQQQPHQSMPLMPQTQYLPPTFMERRQLQQMQQVPQMAQGTLMHPLMHVPMQPSLAHELPEMERQQMMEYTQEEPQPAHTLTANGYQYKTSTSFPTPRAAASPAGNKKRFRLRQ